MVVGGQRRQLRMRKPLEIATVTETTPQRAPTGQGLVDPGLDPFCFQNPLSLGSTVELKRAVDAASLKPSPENEERWAGCRNES